MRQRHHLETREGARRVGFERGAGGAEGVLERQRLVLVAGLVTAAGSARKARENHQMECYDGHHRREIVPGFSAMVIRPRPQGVPFGRYLIRRRLGNGGMGEVFLADQLGPLGPVRPVALKRMLPGLAKDRDTARLFLEEMAIAAQLNHPNIATTYDFGEIEGDYFLAMEYVEGLSLNRIIAALGPLPPPAALQIVKQIADALSYAHAKRSEGRAPVVHQDVSPHNVMISREGGVKLLDFGIARAETAVHGGRVRAKAAYAAPEQLRGAAPDRRFDLWSLGVVLYECLTGRRPFEGDDLMAILAAAEARRHPPLSALRPEVEPFEELVTRALEPDPDRRWLGAEAFRAACLRLGERFGMAVPTDLGLLMERAGGPDAKDDIAEVSGTGVAALDAEAMAALQAVDARSGQTDTAPAPAPATPSRRPLVAALLTALVVAMGVVVWNRPPPEPKAEPIVEAVVPERGAPPPVKPIIRDEPSGDRAAAPAEVHPPARRPKRRRPKINAHAPPPTPPPSRAPLPPPPAEGFGKLSVRTDPTWARLLLDGQPIGRTILYGRPFDPGPHRLQMEPGDDGFSPLDTTITIKPGVTTNVFANFRTRQVKVVER